MGRDAMNIVHLDTRRTWRAARFFERRTAEQE